MLQAKKKRTGKRGKLSALLTKGLVVLGLGLCGASPARAAGTLTVSGSPDQPIQIRDHHVDLTINNGFARVAVSQTFFNPNAKDLEAVYSFPVPKSASLSEVNILAGETEIKGEVVARDKAHEVYEEEKKNGNQAGVADKNSYQDFQFRVARVPAQQETRMFFVYYQPVEIDSGIGRVVYPLEEGGTDEVAKSFWTANTKVENNFSAQITLSMAAQIEEVRVPGFENVLQVDKAQADFKQLSFKTTNVSLTKDLIVYYRLAQNLPGRVELIPYRADPAKPGYYMLVVTPGIDLKPITQGADYTFVLDTSGSMAGKIGTLAKGVVQSLGTLRPQDRFRVITFSDSAADISGGWLGATPENISRMSAQVQTLASTGSTNLYAAVEMALNNLDADRVNSVVLVTDGVTNTGIIDPKEFKNLLKTKDVRFFGFLMGNSSNWPLMELLSQESGGFYAAVSNSDDIVGQIMLAKSKIRSEALHNVTFSLSGVKSFDTTEAANKKIYLGQQYVVFGRYEGSGQATLTVRAALSGEDKSYTTSFVMPDKDTDYPEIERLWAMNQVEAIERKEMVGEMPMEEMKTAIRDLGVAYQIVTDETSMLVLSDEAFSRHNIERKNLARVHVEQAAQSYRASQPVRNNRVDTQRPMFNNSPSYHISNGGGGGGALDPFSVIFGVSLLGGLGAGLRRKKGEQ